MKVDYKNWVPRGLIVGVVFSAVATFAIVMILGLSENLVNGLLRNVLLIVFGIATIILVCLSIWLLCLYRAFSYNGKRKMSKYIIDGISEYINLDEGQVGLDIGCGSGALTIACAKRNPAGTMIGVDRWGKDYGSFSQQLCERNAKAENVKNVKFIKGNAIKLDFPDETFDAVTSNYVYHNISKADKQKLLLETLRTLKKGGSFAIHDIMSAKRYGDMKEFISNLKDMGYEEVKIIDTSHGKFISRREAKWFRLIDSSILLGKK